VGGRAAIVVVPHSRLVTVMLSNIEGERLTSTRRITAFSWKPTTPARATSSARRLRGIPCRPSPTPPRLANSRAAPRSAVSPLYHRRETVGLSDAGNTEYLEKLSAEGRKWGGHLAVEASREMHAWLDHPTVMAHYASRGLIDGSSWNHPGTRQGGGPPEHSMEPGCGSATLSLELHALGATRGRGLRRQPERIAEGEARRTASGVPGRFWAGDANTLKLEPGRYDLIVSSHSYHHFLELERINEQVLRALTPRGLFILEEFVGPTQFQWTDEQIEVSKALMR
jgi:SAM-dependent methyltransferase